MAVKEYLGYMKRGLRRSGPPIHLTLFVTGKCNLRCRHCFHFREVAAGVDGPSLEQVQALADSSAAMGPLLWVALAGGEPFLREDLPELAGSFGQHGVRHISIPTNGLVGERQHESVERMLSSCPETHLNVAVSIDGTPEIHDSIRQVEGGYERSVAATRRFVEQSQSSERLGVGVIVTVTRENEDTLCGHLEELVRETGAQHLTINLARTDALDQSLLSVNPDRYREVVMEKRRLQDAGVLGRYEHPFARVAEARDRLMYQRVESVSRGAGGQHLPCTAGELSAVIFEDGTVRACEVLDDDIGNLNDVNWDLSRLWGSTEAEGLRDKIKETRCECTWECAQADNVLFQPRLWPKLAAEAVKA